MSNLTSHATTAADIIRALNIEGGELRRAYDCNAEEILAAQEAGRYYESAECGNGFVRAEKREREK